MSRAQALVLAGHGSRRDADSAAPLHAHADHLRAGEYFDEVRVAFWKEEPALWDVGAAVQSDVAYVVPVLTSEGYFADEVFPRELGVGAGGTPGPEIHYADPVGTHDAMTDVVEDRVESAIEGRPSEVGVALVGHGTGRNERSAEATKRHAGTLRSTGRYADVGALFLDEAPYVADVTDHLGADELVVVPFFVADGYHTTRDIPDAMGHPGIGETATIDGRTVRYTGAVGTEPSLVDVIAERAVEAGAAVAAATDHAPSAAGGAFVEWVDASASGRSWGELAVRDTTEGYELRHRDDAGADRSSLDAVDGPAALRERVRHDDRGRYRPLSGARTLPTGWACRGLDADALVRAVRTVYPASIEHWYRGRAGDLAPTHFHGTAARQTGIYADLDGVDVAALAATVEAVCGSCVRRRRWDRRADEPIDAPRGDGRIPCRVACPFFLSAAHAFHESDGDAADEPDSDVPVYALSNRANEYRVRYAGALAEPRVTEGAALATNGGEP